MKIRKITTTPGGTKAFGRSFARTLRGGELILLIGELGSGKTTFTQGLLSGFGVRGGSSPTFVVHKTYPVQKIGPIARIHHLDLYRLPPDDSFLIQDIVSCLEPDSITLVEWGDRLPASLRKRAITIYFLHRSKHQREIRTLPAHNKKPSSDRRGRRG